MIHFILFGCGLSYTNFEYADLRIKDLYLTSENVKIEATLKNTGDFDGDDAIIVKEVAGLNV